MDEAKLVHWLAAALTLFALEASAQRQFNPNEVIVLPDSKVIRSVYEEQVTSDLFALLVAQAKFRLAGDQKAERALDEYLARVGLLALAGETVTPSGTIGRIVADPVALPSVPGDLIPRILASLKPRLAVSLDAEKHLPDPRMMFQTHKMESPGLWISSSQRGAETVHVLLLIENAGRNLIRQFDARLLVDQGSGAKPLALECRPSPWFDSMAPGESRVHACSGAARRVVIPDLIRALNNPSSWRLVPTRINFADPAVNFGSNGVYGWLERARAGQQASAALRAEGCRARGSCWEDLRMKVSQDPRYVLVPVGALAGVLLGWLFARIARRPLLFGALLTLLAIGGGATVVVSMFTQTTGMAGLVPLYFGMLGFSALAPFLLTFWVTIAIVRSRARIAS